MAVIGALCRPNHPVFSVVADDLRDRGHDVQFFDPEETLPRAEIDDLDALVNKKNRLPALYALHYADRVGVPTWNGFVASAVLNARLVAQSALEAVGCRTPAVSLEKPDGEYVAKPLFSWGGDPELGGEGGLYQERLRTDPVDYKYYVVHDGRDRHATVLKTTSKLTAGKEVLGVEPPDPRLLARVDALRERLGARSVGVDFVDTPEGWYAVDANVAPSFRHTNLESAIAASLVDLTRSRSR